MAKICCVYKLTNTVTGKFYIGSTVNFASRMHYHKNSHDKNPNKELGSDIARYGWDTFKQEILEVCTRDNLRERERFYIDSLDAVNSGYNMTEATTYRDWMRGYNATMWKDAGYRAERSKQSSEVQLRRLQDPQYLQEKSRQLKRYTDTLKKPIGMFSKSEELLRTFSGVREAERWLNDNGITASRHASACISDCALGKRHKTAYGYIWRFV